MLQLASVAVGKLCVAAFRKDDAGLRQIPYQGHSMFLVSPKDMDPTFLSEHAYDMEPYVHPNITLLSLLLTAAHARCRKWLMRTSWNVETSSAEHLRLARAARSLSVGNSSEIMRVSIPNEIRFEVNHYRCSHFCWRS